MNSPRWGAFPSRAERRRGVGVIIGMDEAGYGPNLGPLVVTTTVWEVPGAPHETTFWPEFAGLIEQHAPAGHTHLQIADSKVVHNASRGVAALEMGVLAALGMGAELPATLCGLWDRVGLSPARDGDCEPWFAGHDLPLPHSAELERIRHFAERWSERCAQHGIRLRQIKSDIVLTRRFNAAIRQHDSKGVALSRISLNLLGEVWQADSPEATLIIADKHGGRNRYDELLQEIAGEQFIFRREEGPQRSTYRIGAAEIHFQTRAEAHLPVALASMVCKYLRELTMILFNDFWQSHLPELRPTKGYPVDARRFRREIAATQRDLQIVDEDLWRER
jgi:hypothetical protein